MPLSDERLAEIRDLLNMLGTSPSWTTFPRELLAAYDEQRAVVERLRAQVAAVEEDKERALDGEFQSTLRAETLRRRIGSAIDHYRLIGHVPLSVLQAALASPDEVQNAE